MTQTVDLNIPDEGLLGGTLSKEPKKGFEEGNLQEYALKVKLEKRKTLLNVDRLTWWPNWLDLGNHFIPFRGRYIIPDGWDTNKGYRRNWSIVDSTPLVAANTLAAGLVAGVTSKSRPWFEYSIEDKQLLEAPGVKEWLGIATDKARAVLARSNFYNIVYTGYLEFGVWGTMAIGREWPFHERAPSFQPFTIGSYYCGQDSSRRVNLFFRDFMWTTSQIVERFATGPLHEQRSWQRISARTQSMYKNGQEDTWIPMTHAIYENLQRVKVEGVYKADASGMRFRSVYYERGGEPDKILSDSDKAERGHLLRVGGFRDMPVWVARWYTNSEDVWGRGPGMDALGDARALQMQQMRKAQSIDRLVDPPMVADATLRTQRTSLLPGDVTFLAPEAAQVGFKPVYEIKPDIQALIEDIQETQGRIKTIMYTDIFAMFIQAERSGQPITAAEVDARQQEKLLMLGPVLEQLSYEFLGPLHEWLLPELMRRGMLPPPPKAMIAAGTSVHVTYTSILANAIQAITFNAIKAFTAFVAQVAELTAQAQENPAMDKVDWDETLEEAANATQVPPSMIRSDADVAQIRQQRQQRQQAQAQAEQQAQQARAALQQSQAARHLSETQTGTGSALDVLAQSVGAGAVPTGAPGQ